MGFKLEEKQALLSLKGVGPTVVKRFEEIGITSFEELKQYRAEDIAEMVASMLNTTCWKNSPQAKSAINAAIQLAANK
jgi:predicted flap endonuclease-1-like 5' DNA nuclease